MKRSLLWVLVHVKGQLPTGTSLKDVRVGFQKGLWFAARLVRELNAKWGETEANSSADNLDRRTHKAVLAGRR